MTGIIDVGGGIRGVFSSGIYDAFLDEGFAEYLAMKFLQKAEQNKKRLEQKKVSAMKKWNEQARESENAHHYKLGMTR